jgi:coatomer subunit alpha
MARYSVAQKDVSRPYCRSRFVPSVDGQLCIIFELAMVGADASGLAHIRN